MLPIENMAGKLSAAAEANAPGDIINALEAILMLFLLFQNLSRST